MDAGIFPDSGKFAVELIQGNGRHRAGIIQVEFNLLFRRQGVDHTGDTADQIHGIEHIDCLRAVGHGDSQLFTGTDAQGFQRFCTKSDLFNQFCISSGLAHEIKSHIIGVFLCNGFHSFKHGALKIIKVHGYIAHIILPGGFYSH